MYDRVEVTIAFNMSQPIFILCYSRSGSTLLRYIFDTHSDICSPPELHLGQLCYHLAKAYANTIDRTPDAIKNAFQLCQNNLNEIMSAYCHRHNASIWCEKSVSTIDMIEIIQNVFPDARYITLHRQCRDTVHSSLEALQKFPERGPQGFGWAPNLSKYPNNTIAGLVAYWEEKTSRLLKFESSFPSICKRVRYEDIVQQPEATLSDLFTSLNIDWQSSLINDVFSSNHDIGPGDDKIQQQNNIHTDSIDKGNVIDITSIPDDLLSRVNSLNTQLNYLLL